MLITAVARLVLNIGTTQLTSPDLTEYQTSILSTANNGATPFFPDEKKCTVVFIQVQSDSKYYM